MPGRSTRSWPGGRAPGARAVSSLCLARPVDPMSLLSILKRKWMMARKFDQPRVSLAAMTMGTIRHGRR